VLALNAGLRRAVVLPEGGAVSLPEGGADAAADPVRELADPDPCPLGSGWGDCAGALLGEGSGEAACCWPHPAASRPSDSSDAANPAIARIRRGVIVCSGRDAMVRA
jgi:hypothetical protein